jgi:protein SCO1/2
MEKLHKILRILILVLGMAVMGLAWWRHDRRPKPGVIVPASGPVSLGKLPSFNFINQNGESFSHENLRGKFWVADFIFTRCPGICPVMTTRMAEIQKEFSSKENLSFVSFTVDPEYDSPPVLLKYASAYQADYKKWNFLTGKRADIYDLAIRGFHLGVVEGQTPDDPMQLTHSTKFILVGPEMDILGYFDSNEPAPLKELRDKIKQAI